MKVVVATQPERDLIARNSRDTPVPVPSCSCRPFCSAETCRMPIPPLLRPNIPTLIPDCASSLILAVALARIVSADRQLLKTRRTGYWSENHARVTTDQGLRIRD